MARVTRNAHRNPGSQLQRRYKVDLMFKIGFIFGHLKSFSAALHFACFKKSLPVCDLKFVFSVDQEGRVSENRW